MTVGPNMPEVEGKFFESAKNKRAQFQIGINKGVQMRDGDINCKNREKTRENSHSKRKIRRSGTEGPIISKVKGKFCQSDENECAMIQLGIFKGVQMRRDDMNCKYRAKTRKNSHSKRKIHKSVTARPIMPKVKISFCR